MSAHLHGTDIAKLLSETGPVVKCVLLRAEPPVGKTDPASRSHSKQEEISKASTLADSHAEKPVLTDLVEEIEVDTTPKKSMVAQVLGGPFTFLGQYEDEGIVLMVRRPANYDEEEEEDDDDDQRDTTSSNIPPLNPHQLQPPLDDVQVRGDILVMKVAPTDEVLDDAEADAGQDSSSENQQKELVVPSNADFFLNYTKDEYVAFASRTDIVAERPERSDEDSEGEAASEDEEEDDDGDDDEEYKVEEDDEEDEDEENKEHHVGMMNLILGQVLRRFHEENGRGPDTRELLEIRCALAEKMGVAVPAFDQEGADWDQKANKKKKTKVVGPEDVNSESPCRRPILTRKRSSSHDDSSAAQQDDANANETKKVKFSEAVHDNVKLAPAASHEEVEPGKA